ncbi:MAG: Rieske 2Fe-2S domain-containing protein [Actinomycetota bacterium]|nr:Rieske 2Fe-2S domain-containing protein [Actinomycetota bacterium]
MELGPQRSTLEHGSLEDLVDWRRGAISGEIFADPAIHARETEQLFPRAWLFLAHESQLRRAGDFVSTFMGADAVIVVRDGDGTIRGMLNACRHRGMPVCRVDSGNARVFTCPFHGWSYDRSGTLVNVPLLDTAYHNELDTTAWGLIPVPRVASYKGLVFATFDESAPSLLDYLGDMAWYLDSMLDRRDGGTEGLGGVHKIRMHGNWKLVAEQFAGDNYHAVFAHASAPTAWSGDDPEGAAPRFSGSMSSAGRQFAGREGHGTAGFFLSSKALTGGLRAMTDDHRLVADYYDATNDEVADRLGAERSRGPSGTAALVFPTFTYLEESSAPPPLGSAIRRGPTTSSSGVGSWSTPPRRPR